jgi:hypothetical protein
MFPMEARRVKLLDPTVEGHRKDIRLGLIGCLITALSSIVALEGARRIGFPLPAHFLLFILLFLGYLFCVFLRLLLKRMKK